MKTVFKLPELPFSPKHVEGLMSKEAIRYHYEKHHAGYVEKANSLIDRSLSSLRTGDIIQKAEEDLRDQVSQIWNHTFLWHSLYRPKAHPLSEFLSLSERIEHSFESLSACKDDFIERGTNHFASGWLFLGTRHPESLNLEWIDLHDAGSPFLSGFLPLLCTDLWEHAYYVDFRHDRKKYLDACFDHLNWKFAADNLRRQTPLHFENEIKSLRSAA